MTAMPESLHASSPLHKPAPHESGLRHTSGEARYVDDLLAPHGLLVAQVVVAPHAHARLKRLELGRARAVAGVHAVLAAADVPGLNNVGPVVHDEPLFVSDEALFMGQSVALVVGETYDACRAGVAAVVAEWEPLPACTTLEAGLAAGQFLSEPHVMQQGREPSAAGRSAETPDAATAK